MSLSERFFHALFFAVSTNLLFGLSVFSQSQTAQGVVTSYSLALSYGTGRHSGTGAPLFVAFSTSDGVENNWPQGLEFQLWSDELRPTSSGSFNYETDFAVAANGNWETRGVLRLSLPAMDSNLNGMPDVLEIDRLGNFSATAITREYGWNGSFLGSFAYSISVTRAAGSPFGTYSASGNGAVVSGQCEVVGGRGSAVYNRSNGTIGFSGNSFSFDKSGSGSSTFTRNSDNQISVAGFNFITSDGLTRRVNSFTMQRAGSTYRGSARFQDGWPETSYADYMDCLVEIFDSNDFDYDGVPDFSDGSVSFSYPAGGGLANGISSFSPNHSASLTRDGNDETAWGSTPGSFPKSLAIDFGSGARSGNGIYLHTGFPGTTSFHSTQVEVLGSNDNSNWTSLGVFPTVYGRNTLSLDRTYSYRYWMLKALAGPTEYWSVREFDIFVLGPPAAPTGLVATAGDGQVSVAFTAGANGGSAITNYQFSTDNGATWTARSPASATSPLVIGSLANGFSYSIRIRAVNASGEGTASATVTATPAALPGAPTGLGVTMAAGTASLSWSAPANSGGLAISDYQVQYSVSGGAWTTFNDGVSTATTATVTGLPISNLYGFRVATVTSAGRGSYGAEASVMTFNFPTGGGPVAVPSGSFAPQHPVSHAFDGNDETAWGSVWSAIPFPIYMGYDFLVAKTINIITLNHGFPGTTSFHASKVEVLGSNNNSTWTTLGTFNTVYGVNVLSLSSPGAYRYYILKALAGPTNHWAIREISASPDPFARTFYVSSLATGANNGLSWDNAYTDLGIAWSIANRSSDEIVIRPGTYILQGRKIKVIAP